MIEYDVAILMLSLGQLFCYIMLKLLNIFDTTAQSSLAGLNKPGLFL